MKKFIPEEFEKKWREEWKKTKSNEFNFDDKKRKFYNLVELPYPSGDLHIGHWFTFAMADFLARYKRMNGDNVFFPMGFDAFGLPAENAAIKRGIHPKDWTMGNVEAMTKQFQTMGTMIDWSNVVITCLPEFYRWNQWIFIQLFKKGLAYRKKALSNWCEIDQTVLANEGIENGRCWRCGNLVVQKEIEQWFLKITDYADELIWPDDPTVDWPMSVRVGQNNWIGKSEGVEIDFPLAEGKSKIKVFTTMPETIDAATFLVLAPEHPFVTELIKNNPEVKKYVDHAKQKSEEERKIGAKDKSGIFTGVNVTNPFTKNEIPLWISDYVLSGYGTGAVMGVPGEDERDGEFAKKFDIPIVKSNFEAKPEGQKKVHYHIHDWSISRQRYWGTPVPMIHCPKCGIAPVPEEDLPIELPYEVDFMPKGKPPLATNEKWMNVKCPTCHGPAKRDAETLDTFFDSSWYFFRYVSPHYDKGPFDKDKVKKLLPVDIYFGGAEHTLGHTLYARFFTRFFKKLGLIDFDEFALKRVQHGVVLGPDGNRMSKSKGNVVNPDDVVSEYGSDTVRLYLGFMMPYEATAAWSTDAIAGIHRFLMRVWNLSDKVKTHDLNKEDSFQMNKTIQKVGSDISQIKSNTAIAALMEWLNFLSKKEAVSTQEYETLLILLAPFAPHMTEELWHDTLKKNDSIHLVAWPKVNEKELVKETVNIPVQINGKMRGVIEIIKGDTKDTVVEKALQDEKVNRYTQGKDYEAIYVNNKILNFVIRD